MKIFFLELGDTPFPLQTLTLSDFLVLFISSELKGCCFFGTFREINSRVSYVNIAHLHILSRESVD